MILRHQASRHPEGETGTQLTVEETRVCAMLKGNGNVWMEDIQVKT